MTKKKLCVIDSCEYCPYLEKIFVDGNHKSNPLIDADLYKCNKSLLCVENGKITPEYPLKLLFKNCPLPTNIDEDDEYFEEDISF